MRIFYLVVGPESQPGVRERIARHRRRFEAEGVETRTHVAGDVQPGTLGTLQHLAAIGREGWRSDLVYNYRVLLSSKELTVLRAFSRCRIFDFDDAIFSAPPFAPASGTALRDREERLAENLGACRLAIAGNAFLADWARPHCPQVEIVPTGIDVTRYAAAARPPRKTVTIGWIGLGHNLYYLETVRPALERVLHLFPHARIRVVSNAEFRGAENLPWSLEDEAALLDSFDIGVMPLTDDPWSRGKCSYKALQSMAAGLPVVVSPVGMNAEVVRDGVDGLHASTEEEWVDALSRLIRDPSLRGKLGGAARRRVEERYSTEIVWNRLRSLLLPISSGGP